MNQPIGISPLPFSPRRVSQSLFSSCGILDGISPLAIAQRPWTLLSQCLNGDRISWLSKKSEQFRKYRALELIPLTKFMKILMKKKKNNIGSEYTSRLNQKT